MRYRAFVLSILATLGLVAGGFAGVAAQDASPAADGMITYGLPELQIALTDSGFEGVPSETAAGWTFVSFTNNSAEEDAIVFIQVPEGRTLADIEALAQVAGGPPPEGEGEMASPDAMGDMASPEAGMDMGSPPAGGEDPFAEFAWFFETYIAGGIAAGPGETGQVIVDLQPGNYAVASDFFSSVPAVALTVTGEAMASPAAAGITADATITEIGMGGDFFDFEVSGDPQPGQNLIEITNNSDQPHFVEIVLSPEPVTEDQVMQILMTEEGAPPPEGVPDPSQFQFGYFYASTQSAGSTQYVVANLQPGYHVIVCFIPDPVAGGVPHAFEGMIQVVPVGVEDAATPAA